MGDKTVSVRVRFEGGDQVKAGLVEVGREGTRALQQIGGVSKQTGAALQNAGYQVSDFFVQIAGGTAPTRALAQQMPQLLQGLGLIGVAASVLVAALPSLWTLFSSGEESAKSLEKELEGVSKAVDAYSSAVDLAIEPMDRLIKKYGELAGSVREARVQQAELARGDAMRAVNGLLSGIEDGGELKKFGPSDIASSGSSREQILQRLKAAELEYRAASAASDQERMIALAQEELQLKSQLATLGEIRSGVAAVASEYGVTNEQALGLAVAVERVRDSASQSAAEQVAAASALSNYLIEVYGSADAANEATGGLVERLNAAITAAADVAAAAGGIAGAIGAGADEAARLASNLAFAMAQQNLAASGKVYSGRGGDPRTSNQQGEGKFVYTGPTLDAFNVPVVRGGSRGGGGGGGSDPDLARAKALTEGVRTETEKYAIALEEVDRLKKRGLITDETYNRQLDKLQDKLGDVGDLGKKAASAIKSAFSGLFDDPKEALKDLAKQLAMMALFDKILPNALPGLFGSGGFLNGVKGFAGGGMHSGGLRIVGENGPELEATGPSMIYPNSALRGLGGGGSSVQVFNYGKEEARADTRRGPDGREMVRVIVGEEIARGRMDKPMRGRFGSAPNKVVR